MWSPCVGGEKNYAQRRKKTKVVNRTITKKNGKKALNVNHDNNKHRTSILEARDSVKVQTRR